MDWTFLGAFTVAVVGLCGTWLTARIQHKGRPENALIDQLQEEIKAIREEKAAENAIMRADILALKEEQKQSRKRERKRDHYISILRNHIDTGQGPPAPPWPEDYDD